MRHPQVIVTGQDETLANQLVHFVEEHRWRLIQIPDALKVRPAIGCPTVLILQIDVEDTHKARVQEVLASIHLEHPDVSIVAVLSAKIGSDDRVAWLAGLFDLGARYVMVPPHTRSVLEDVVGGLMNATIARVVETPNVEDVVDLADEESIP